MVVASNLVVVGAADAIAVIAVEVVVGGMIVSFVMGVNICSTQKTEFKRVLTSFDQQLSTMWRLSPEDRDTTALYWSNVVFLSFQLILLSLWNRSSSPPSGEVKPLVQK